MIQISITIGRDSLDRAEQVLRAHGAQSVTLRDAADNPILEPSPGATPVWPELTVNALFDNGADTELLRNTLEEFMDPRGFEVTDVAERDWARACLDDLKPLRFGERLRVCPGDDSQDSHSDTITVRLAPGLAFGTGAHPTTALCLEWLDANPPVGAEVIDYGCGSGILALAAIKLGARRVRAVDIDPQALAATLDNAARNGIFARQIIVCHPDDLAHAPADVLLANILARPLMELAGNFAGRLKTGGRLILSGMLPMQTAELAKAYARWFDFAAPRCKDAWALLTGVRR